MMSFARLLFVFLLTLLVILIGVGIFLPDSVRVSRQALRYLWLGLCW